MGLNPKRRLFARNFVENGGNGTRAYQDAYKSTPAAARANAPIGGKPYNDGNGTAE